jgi:GH15 family glucan-1,4-alpha-glucosidase
MSAVSADVVGRVVPGGAVRAPRARYLPIAEHGLIGDLHTVALAGTDGTVDWYCCPRFDRWRSRRCSPTRTTSGCTRRRSGRQASSSQLPPASTHLALISAAHDLDRQLG